MKCYWKTYRGKIMIRPSSIDGYVEIKDHLFSVVGYADYSTLQKSYLMIAPVMEYLDKTSCLIRIGVERCKPTVWITGRVNIKIMQEEKNQIYLSITKPSIHLLRMSSVVLIRGLVKATKLSIITKYL